MSDLINGERVGLPAGVIVSLIVAAVGITVAAAAWAFEVTSGQQRQNERLANLEAAIARVNDVDNRLLRLELISCATEDRARRDMCERLYDGQR